MRTAAPLVALSKFDADGQAARSPAKEYRKVTTQASTNPLRRVPVQGRSVARVQRMLDACAELVDEIGYEALTTTLLAERAGVAIGSVYQFFPDKRAIVQALALRNLEAYLARLSARSEAVEFDHWWDIVDAAIDEYITMHREVPGFRTLHFGDVVDVHLLDAERDNNTIIAEQLAGLLVQHFGAAAGPRLDFALAIAVEAGDALIKLAFRRDPDGEAEVLTEAKALIREYLHRHVDTIPR
jgi:AcrR family transcriptional regulator